jgi:hypothetical protein
MYLIYFIYLSINYIGYKLMADLIISTLYNFWPADPEEALCKLFIFFVKFIAEGAINERKNKQFASDSLGDAVTKLYKVEIISLFRVRREDSRRSSKRSNDLIEKSTEKGSRTVKMLFYTTASKPCLRDFSSSL